MRKKFLVNGCFMESKPEICLCFILEQVCLLVRHVRKKYDEQHKVVQALVSSLKFEDEDHDQISVKSLILN